MTPNSAKLNLTKNALFQLFEVAGEHQNLLDEVINDALVETFLEGIVAVRYDPGKGQVFFMRVEPPDEFKPSLHREFSVAMAKTVEEAKQMVENGFEYVCQKDNVMIFRKKKRR